MRSSRTSSTESLELNLCWGFHTFVQRYHFNHHQSVSDSVRRFESTAQLRDACKTAAQGKHKSSITIHASIHGTGEV